jgi:Bacterial PH domain
MARRRIARLRHSPSSILHPRFRPVPLSASEGAAGAATADGAAPTATSLATLLSRHILRDGEVVILLLKPSPLFIALTSIRFIAVIALLVTAIFLFDVNDRFQWNTVAVIEGGIFIVAGRLMWAVLQWMARLYVLTDLRVLRISGVFTVHIFDCPLRKVARTRVLQSTRDRLLGVGSIEIIPVDDNEPEGVWQTIAKPRMVHEQVVATINKAKQGGCL